ncbi:MAG: hypothetical protein BWK79_13680 [Beggiatoa sp. IS2]|nr:MAG: hypothetical protein BWK79_13680 [Beggiatoa sp. IS2]
MSDFCCFIIAFSVTALLLFSMKTVATYTGLVDHPNGRKCHQGDIPLIGGIAMFCGFFLAVSSLGQTGFGLRILFIGSLFLTTVGILDDLKGLSSGMRFGAQILTALVMSIQGILLQDFGMIGFGNMPVILGIFAIPLTIFATVGVINALNMSDGMDGLAGGLALITLISLTLAAWIAGLELPVKILLLFITSILAFLSFNMRLFGRQHALVFMGNSGSLFLGFAIAWFLISLSQGEQRAITPVTALWIFALPLFDTVSIMLRRILRGCSPFAADREHLHHTLLSAGFSVSQTLAIILGIAASLAAIGLIGLYARVFEVVMFWTFLGLFALYFFCMIRAWKVYRFLGRPLKIQLSNVVKLSHDMP